MLSPYRVGPTIDLREAMRIDTNPGTFLARSKKARRSNARAFLDFRAGRVNDASHMRMSSHFAQSP
ncbi:hypothetical protein MesoLjLc_06830 [Mesorhizobium sp. L-8-10]|nr:hypothetical protein MesoLjLc_06830 [Mesorhizobium sp. L-8-10]